MKLPPGVGMVRLSPEELEQALELSLRINLIADRFTKDLPAKMRFLAWGFACAIWDDNAKDPKIADNLRAAYLAGKQVCTAKLAEARSDGAFDHLPDMESD